MDVYCTSNRPKESGGGHAKGNFVTTAAIFTVNEPR